MHVRKAMQVKYSTYLKEEGVMIDLAHMVVFLFTSLPVDLTNMYLISLSAY